MAIAEAPRISGFENFAARKAFEDFWELSKINDAHTREIIVSQRKANKDETYNGKPVKADTRFALYNISMPAGWKFPRYRNRVMDVTRREYADGTTGCTIRLDAFIPNTYGSGFKENWLGNILYEDDGIQSPGGSESYQCEQESERESMLEGIKPACDYPKASY